MTKSDTFAQLMHKAADSIGLEGTALSVGVHIALKILFAKLENQDQFLFSVNNVVQADNVGVAKFFHERDLANRSRRRSLLGIEMDLL